MAISVKKIKLWRRELENQPGTLAQTLEPLARSGTNLKMVMSYNYTGDPRRAAVELFPITGAKSTAAAQQAGLSASSIPTLLIEGDNRAGLGHALAKAIASAGINLGFTVALVVGNRFSAVFGFSSDADADRAMPLIKQAGRATPIKKKKTTTTKKRRR
jgi:hypothetical protein